MCLLFGRRSFSTVYSIAEFLVIIIVNCTNQHTVVLMLLWGADYVQYILSYLTSLVQRLFISVHIISEYFK